MTISHLTLLIRLHPHGVVSLDDTTVAEDLAVLGAALDVVWLHRDDLMLEILPDRAAALLSDWERVYDIHKVGTRTIQQRQARLVARRRLLPNFRPATIEDLCETLTGLTITVVEPFAFRCDDAGSLTDTSTDVLDGAFVFFVEFPEAAARAAGTDRDELQALIDRVKPAHTIGIIRCDDFRCDDDWSLTDRDLLGS